MMRRITILLLSIVFINACSDEFSLKETEIDLTKDWEETVGVFSNLNLHQRKHYIRINRGFSGNNFFVSNTNPDSIYFDPSQVEATLYKLKVYQITDGIITDADTLGAYECRDTVLLKDTLGMFATDEVPVFYTETSAFSVTDAEKLYVGLKVLTPRRKITSFTKLIAETQFIYPNQFGPPYQIHDSTFDVEIRYPLNSQVYRVEANCSYFEVTRINGVTDTTVKNLTFLIGSQREANPAVDYAGQYRWRESTSLFYDAIERDILSNGDTINTIARVLDGIYFTGYYGNADLALILTGMSTYSGFSDQPINFSNIIDGLGYFSAFAQVNTKKFEFSAETLTDLQTAFNNKYLFTRNFN